MGRENEVTYISASHLEASLELYRAAEKERRKQINRQWVEKYNQKTSLRISLDASLKNTLSLFKKINENILEGRKYGVNHEKNLFFDYGAFCALHETIRIDSSITNKFNIEEIKKYEICLAEINASLQSKSIEEWNYRCIKIATHRDELKANKKKYPALTKDGRTSLLSGMTVWILAAIALVAAPIVAISCHAILVFHILLIGGMCLGVSMAAASADGYPDKWLRVRPKSHNDNHFTSSRCLQSSLGIFATRKKTSVKNFAPSAPLASLDETSGFNYGIAKT